MSESITTLPANPTRPGSQKPAHQPDTQPRQGVAELSQVQQQKESLNVAILESAAAIIGVKDEPLALVLSSAIERINEVLAPTLGNNAIQKTASSGLDVSPEATAERIASLSTAFYSAFKAQHPGEDEVRVLTNFIQTISSGIETGFGEARDILDGLGVLEGDIASDIDQTFALVQEKLAAFEAMIIDMNDLVDTDVDASEQLESFS